MLAVQEALRSASPEIEGSLLTWALDPEGIDPPQALAAVFDSAMAEVDFQRMKQEVPEMDTMGALRQVRAPVLVVHYRKRRSARAGLRSRQR